MTEYCGLTLNEQFLFEKLLLETKTLEVRTVKRSNIPGRVVFHPCKKLRDQGFNQNIEAFILPFEHENILATARDVLKATNDGQMLGMTKKKTIQFVRRAKKKNQTARFYLYAISQPKISDIVWIDSKIFNQVVFSKHEYRIKRTGEVVTLFKRPGCA
jgi:hypothetical protein